MGTNFRDLHLRLNEITVVARADSDEIAERMRALHSSPDGRPAEIAGQTRLPEFPNGEISTHDAIDHMVASIEATVASIRGCRDEVDSADPTTADGSFGREHARKDAGSGDHIAGGEAPECRSRSSTSTPRKS